MHRAWPNGIALAVTILLAAGCDAGDSPDAAEGPAQEAGAAELAPVNRSGVTGTVRADHDGDEVTVTVEVAGLEAGGEYPAHIHSGRCAAGGPVAVPLGRITAGEDGTGRLTTRVAAAELGAEDAAFVQVHGADGAVVACADLGGHGDGEQPLTERIDSAAAPVAAPEGDA